MLSMGCMNLLVFSSNGVGTNAIISLEILSISSFLSQKIT
jgi:hypothetical protein